MSSVDTKITHAFRVLKITRPEPVTACEAFFAVYRSANRPDVTIGGSTLDDLADRWEQFCGMKLDETHVQHVVVTAWKDTDAQT